MMRAVYLFILRLHPASFRQRFADEMVSIFDEESMHPYARTMVADGFASLTRQWVLRNDAWKIFAALAGAFFQVWGCGLRTFGHDQWSRNSQNLTPYMQQVILITLAALCILFVMVISLTLWAMRLQRRETRGRRVYVRQ